MRTYSNNIQSNGVLIDWPDPVSLVLDRLQRRYTYIVARGGQFSARSYSEAVTLHPPPIDLLIRKVRRGDRRRRCLAWPTGRDEETTLPQYLLNDRHVAAGVPIVRTIFSSGLTSWFFATLATHTINGKLLIITSSALW